MLITGHLLISGKKAIENLIELNYEVTQRHSDGNPLPVRVNQRVRMEFSSLSPMVITKEYGGIFRRGPQYYGPANLASIVLFKVFDTVEVAPVMAIDAPSSGYYGFESNVNVLNALSNACGMGERFKEIA